MSFAASPNLPTTSAASQCVIAIIGTWMFCSSICRTAVAAPLECPLTISRSGLRSLTFVRIALMSDRSRGNCSSTTVFMSNLAASSSTPARMSSEKGSFSTATATLTEEAGLPLASAISAASATADARYCSEVESTAKR